MTIDSTTGVISGTVAPGDDANGPYSVTVTATDTEDASVSASETFQWTMNATGTITVSLANPGNQTNSEEDAVSLALSATDSAVTRCRTAVTTCLWA